jgi:hypothetical protein
VARRFITKADIDELADRGETTLELDARATITDLAREHAQQRGVRVVRAADAHAPAAATHDAPASATEPGSDEVRAAVRSAVIGRLGEVPGGLDAAIDRVLRSHRP